MSTRIETQIIYEKMSTILSKNEIPEAVRWANMGIVFHDEWRSHLQQIVDILECTIKVSNSVSNEMDMGMQYSENLRNKIFEVITRAKVCEEKILECARLCHLQMIECSALAELELKKYAQLEEPDSVPPSPPPLPPPSSSRSPPRLISPVNSLVYSPNASHESLY